MMVISTDKKFRIKEVTLAAALIGFLEHIDYDSLAKVQLSDEGRKLVAELDEELDQDELTETQKAKTRWTQIEALIGSEKRI